MAVTLSILDRFAKFFRCCKEHQSSDSLLPYYITLGKLKNQKFCNFRARKTCFKCDVLSSISQMSW